MNWKNNLVETPVTFNVVLDGVKIVCKLGFKGDFDGGGEYTLEINDVPVSELPEAPPITKENVPEVCRSDYTEFPGESRIRKTWNLFK